MFKRLIRKHIREVLELPMEQPAPPVRQTIDVMMHEQDTYATVVCIQNGFLVRLAANRTSLGPTIIYCCNEKEVAEQISAHAVRARLNIPSHVKLADVSSKPYP